MILTENIDAIAAFLRVLMPFRAFDDSDLEKLETTDKDGLVLMPFRAFDDSDRTCSKFHKTHFSLRSRVLPAACAPLRPSFCLLLEGFLPLFKVPPVFANPPPDSAHF